LKRRGALLRPFCLEHGLQPGGFSRKVRRAMVDFGAEVSFAAAAARMREHHDLNVRAEEVRQETYQHARTMAQLAPAARPPSAVMVAQIDGSMVPILQRGAACADKRRARQIGWQELKACLARDQNCVTPIFGATLGSVQVAGLLWRETAQRAGLNAQSHVHAVGDGAPWILAQTQEQFGPQGSYLVDFYHVSEYLAAAAPPAKKPGDWLKRQQGHLLKNKVGLVLRNLARRQEPLGAAERPVAKAYAYIEQRRDQMDYAGAQENGLPIGSGEIESAHRHLIQARLKIPGAWKEQNAELMLGLRTARANGLWETSWASHLN
jgi:hypothetical protein